MFLEDRPAFVQIVEKQPLLIINGYTLQIDVENLSASIIKLKKGGNKIMLKQVKKAKQGFEEIYAQLLKMQDNLEDEVRKLVEQKQEEINKMIDDCTYTEEVEVPDEEVVETDETSNI